MAQTLLAALIVAFSAAYVTWVLLPAAARRRVALALLRMRWPAVVATRLQAQAKTPSACGCDGCDGCERRPAPAPPQQSQPVHWAPRRRT